MKGKLTGKIFNLRNIIVILSILIMAVGSGISIVEYNGKNVQTNLGETYNPNNQDFIREALDLAQGNTGYDCSGFVRKVLKQCGVTEINGLDVPTSVSGWSDARNYTDRNGNTYEVKRIVKNVKKRAGVSWYNAVENAGYSMSNLQMGDIVAGAGHMFIYLGKYNDTQDIPAIQVLKNDLTSKLGIDWDNKYDDVRILQWDLKSNTYGGTYWYIEGNTGSGYHAKKATNGASCKRNGYDVPFIRNYGWNQDSGSSTGMGTINVYRISQNTKNVKLNIERQNMEGTGIGGATFEYWVKSTWDNGAMPTNDGTVGTTISLSNIGYGDTRYIWIKEKSAPSGYSIGLKNPIAIKVYVDSNGSISAQKIHDGGQGDIISTYFGGLKSGNNQTKAHNEELKNCGENISVIMKDPKQSSYHVKLGKKSSKDPTGNLIAGASYKVEINNEKETTTKNITTSANEGDSFSGEVPITKDGDDDYKFTENDASGIGYATVEGTYGISVHKGVTDAGEYAITGIKYYSGSGSTLKEKEIKQGEKYWIFQTYTIS